MINTAVSHGGVPRRTFLRRLAGLAVALAPLPACVGNMSTEVSRARERNNIEAAFDTTLLRCYLADPSSREVVSRALGLLVFPTVALVNPLTSEWAGGGVLREGSAFTNYYYLTIDRGGVTQDGATRSVVFVFQTLQALNQLRLAKPWRPAAPTGLVTLLLEGKALTRNPKGLAMAVVPLDL